MQCFKFGRAIQVSWIFHPVYRQKSTTNANHRQADRRDKKKPGSGLSRGAIPAHAVRNEVQRVNRKIKILIALGNTVVVGLALVLWMEKEQPAVSLSFEAVSYGDAGYVLFIATNATTNTMYLSIHEQELIEGRWQIIGDFRRISANLTGQKRQRLSHRVPDTTNAWRLNVRCFSVPPAGTSVGNTRSKLMDYAFKRKWTRIHRWLSPVKERVINGPEMLGNKPVEQK
jgi:hypothetical protein